MNVCVFMGSRFGADPTYRVVAETFGRLLGEAGATMIYGGGSVGLMGASAAAALAAGGRVIGYIPKKLIELEVAMEGLDRLIVTEDMHERKRRMLADADAFAVLPGGMGTLDELLEAITHNQLGYAASPIALIDCEGFWRPTLAALRGCADAGFVSPSTIDALIVEPTPEAAWTKLRAALAREG